MRFNPGDPVWVITMGTDYLPVGLKLEGIVLGAQDNRYVVDISGAPSRYPDTKPWPKGSWLCEKKQLQPRGNEYDGLEIGEWELCPWRPVQKTVEMIK